MRQPSPYKWHPGAHFERAYVIDEKRDFEPEGYIRAICYEIIEIIGQNKILSMESILCVMEILHKGSHKDSFYKNLMRSMVAMGYLAKYVYVDDLSERVQEVSVYALTRDGYIFVSSRTGRKNYKKLEGVDTGIDYEPGVSELAEISIKRCLVNSLAASIRRAYDDKVAPTLLESNSKIPYLILEVRFPVDKKHIVTLDFVPAVSADGRDDISLLAPLGFINRRLRLVVPGTTFISIVCSDFMEVRVIDQSLSRSKLITMRPLYMLDSACMEERPLRHLIEYSQDEKGEKIGRYRFEPIYKKMREIKV